MDFVGGLLLHCGVLTGIWRAFGPPFVSHVNFLTNVGCLHFEVVLKEYILYVCTVSCDWHGQSCMTLRICHNTIFFAFEYVLGEGLLQFEAALERIDFILFYSSVESDRCMFQFAWQCY